MAAATEDVDAITNLRKELETYLKSIRHYPTQPYFSNLSKKLAGLCFAADDDLEGLFHLSESHGVSLRMRATHRYNLAKKNGKPNESSLDPQYLRFEGSYDTPQGLVERLKQLPKEWSVVQLTSETDKESRQRTPLTRHEMPAVWVTCLECGPAASHRTAIVQRIKHDARRDENMRSIVEEVESILHDNKTKPKQFYANSEMYWRSRQGIADRMGSLVGEVQQFLLKQWSFLLLGRLEDSSLERSIRDHVDTALTALSLATLPHRTRHLLYRLAEARHDVAQDDMATLLAWLLPQHSKVASVLAEIQGGHFPGLEKAKRMPVLLIVDESLDAIPWENLDILSSHPVCRIDSIHMLHALYKAHEESVVDGYKMVADPDNGYFMANAENNLQDMEDRLRKYFQLRFPVWKGTFGAVPGSSFKPALTQSDIFLWSGHGSGKQLFASESVETLNIKAVSFLMGCSSIRLTSEGGRTAATGMGQSYHIGNCPCIVGNLWEVSDFDVDRITTSLLHIWLPLTNDLDTHISAYITDKVTEKTKEWRYRREPNLLRALVVARSRATNRMTQYAIIARGLPVKMGR